eukprot:Plantae.Rhodophyta-Palmaria_palmata.ctg14430.p4 GENE.Plantae.Rhodophyta-Palmaria_palmata.ctg14430~~Plantae.Rhodophyta-Palmaria_palmata.ctg14430.p4  ORF type:complete len:105 (+),score=6.93 Plantae.Rhodophyta-Palmaria_palmata.ctg14430:1021-1335(+)
MRSIRASRWSFTQVRATIRAIKYSMSRVTNQNLFLEKQRQVHLLAASWGFNNIRQGRVLDDEFGHIMLELAIEEETQKKALVCHVLEQWVCRVTSRADKAEVVQ